MKIDIKTNTLTIWKSAKFIFSELSAAARSAIISFVNSMISGCMRGNKDLTSECLYVLMGDCGTILYCAYTNTQALNVTQCCRSAYFVYNLRLKCICKLLPKATLCYWFKFVNATICWHSNELYNRWWNIALFFSININESWLYMVCFNVVNSWI